MDKSGSNRSCLSQRAWRKSRRNVVSVLLAGSSALTALVVSGTAQALPLITLSGSARGLYGVPTADLELNPYGLGVGLRGGVTLPASLYLGASFDYFFGESATILGIETSASRLQLMAHLGYDLGLGPFTLRPSLGLGMSDISVEVAGLEESESDFVASPGAEFLIGLGLLSVSAEARYNKVFADDQDAMVLGLGLGFSL
jgi:hypothetical protein